MNSHRSQQSRTVSGFCGGASYSAPSDEAHRHPTERQEDIPEAPQSNFWGGANGVFTEVRGENTHDPGAATAAPHCSGAAARASKSHGAAATTPAPAG
ncbi:hypothetical protein DPEC_G00215090 [Dallia pectoralis]|uniref:Uncharacterized protein n=1 Tax=Dallia pectoralis TaxID=75939 RepID=A0ACC2G286_DALPE|nr:hypothetical protein DPEC_G00215090 [Dallia pectoralis]